MASRFRSWVAPGIVLAVYCGGLFLLPKHVFDHPDAGIKFLTLRAVQWQGGPVLPLPYPGRALDPDLSFYPGHCAGEALYPVPDEKGGVRPHWPLWFVLAGRLLYNAFGFTGLYMLPLLSAWLAALVAGRWVSGAQPWLTAAAVVLAGLGTPLAFYGFMFLEHTLATVVALAATAIMLRRQGRGFDTLVWMAALLMVASVLRIEMLAYAAALGVTWVAMRVLPDGWRRPVGDRALQPRRQWRAYVGVAALILALAVVAAAAMAPRHWQLVRDIPAVLRASAAKLPFLLDVVTRVFMGLPDFVNPLAVEIRQTAVLLSMGAVLIAPCVASRRVEAFLLIGGLLLLFEASVLTAVVSRPYLSNQGVLEIAPYMVIGVYAFAEARRRRDGRLRALALVTGAYAVCAFALIFSLRVNADGMIRLGRDGAARYLLTLYPLAAVLTVETLAAFWHSDRSRVVRSAVTVLVTAMIIAGLVYQVRAFAGVHANRQILVRWERALAQDRQVVTNVWWLPAVLASFTANEGMYCARGADAVGHWVRRAAIHGIERFTFASLEPVELGQFAAPGVEVSFMEERVTDGLHLYGFRFLQTPAFGDVYP